MQAGALYNKEVQRIGKKHKLGAPHVHVAMAVLEALAKMDIKDGGQQVHQQAQAFLSSMVAGLSSDQDGLGIVGRLIGYFMLKAWYYEEGKTEVKRYRLTLSVDPIPIDMVQGVQDQGVHMATKLKQSAWVLLQVAGAELMAGQPPPGELERLMHKRFQRR